VVTVCLVHSLAVSLIAGRCTAARCTATSRARDRPPWLRFQADTLFDRLTEVAVVIGAAPRRSSRLRLLFVPISLEQFMRMETYFP